MGYELWSRIFSRSPQMCAFAYLHSWISGACAFCRLVADRVCCHQLERGAGHDIVGGWCRSHADFYFAQGTLVPMHNQRLLLQLCFPVGQVDVQEHWACVADLALPTLFAHLPTHSWKEKELRNTMLAVKTTPQQWSRNMSHFATLV
jgi:hypothetical protein